MANSINNFVDNIRLNEINSLTYLLNTEDTDELNIIRHSPYYSYDDLLQSSTFHKNGLSMLSLNCQSLHAKFDYSVYKIAYRQVRSKQLPTTSVVPTRIMVFI